MGHVFIAYNNEDGDFAADLIRQIEDAGFPVWSDTERVRTGEQWREAIDQAIRDAFALVLVLTPAATASDQVMYEWTFALGVGVTVIPVILQPTELHPRLKVLPTLDFADDAHLPWGKLIRQVQQARDSARVSPFDARNRERPASFSAQRGAPDRPSSNFLNRLRRRDQDQDENPDRIDLDQADAVPRLIKALNSENRDTRMAAARRLSEADDRQAIPALIKLLRDDDWRVRETAAAALGKMKVAAAVMSLLETLRYGRPGPFGGGPNSTVVLDAIRQIGARAVPVLVDALSDDDWRIRLYAADVLGQIGTAEAVPALIDALRDPETRVRWRAANALGAMQHRAAVPDLIDLLRDSSADVRITAAWALGQIKDGAAVPELIRLLSHREWRVRWAVAEALWEIGEPSIPALMEVLRDPDEHIRRAAIRALAEIGAPAVPALVGALNDSNWDVRCAASTALEELGEPAVPALIEVLHTGGWQASWAAAEALQQIGTPQAVQAAQTWRDGQNTPSDADEAAPDAPTPANDPETMDLTEETEDVPEE
jgi:HEAT repeat protein